MKRERSQHPPTIGRRELLNVMAATAALSATACAQPPHRKLVPYARQPPEVVPGVPQVYATSFELDGFASGLLAVSREGRPIKIEGNPEHPANLGASTVYEQASVLGLYDPDRARSLLSQGQPSTWQRFCAALSDVKDPGRVRLMLEPQSSPLVASSLDRVFERWKGAKVTFYSPLERRSVTRASQVLFGRALEPHFDFTRARVVVSLGADFLHSMPFSTRWAKEFAEGRRLPEPNAPMNRLYVVEPSPTPTGSLADHRLAIPAHRLLPAACALLVELERAGVRLPIETRVRELLARWAEHSPDREWMTAAARDLAAARPDGVVIAGDSEDAAVHALAHLANAALGHFDRTAWFAESPLLERSESEPVEKLVEAMQAGEVDTLFVLGGNPAYDLPADLGFGRAWKRVRRRVCWSLHENETALGATWFVPAAHYLESWGVARAYDGTMSFTQPLIAPLYGGKALTEVLSALAGDPLAESHDLLVRHARERHGAAFPAAFDAELQRGFVPDSAFSRAPVEPRWQELHALLEPHGGPSSRAGALEVRFQPSFAVLDGRFANNPWLQELPDPITKLTWDNAALMSRETALGLGVEDGSLVSVRTPSGSLKAPVLVTPGHADHSITLTLGYGRGGKERVARNVGFRASLVRHSKAPAFTQDVEVKAEPGKHALAVTQRLSELDRPLALHAKLADYRERPELEHAGREKLPTLLPVYGGTGNQWAMTIDTGVCTGCSACVIACQAENNVPVVGKKEVLRHREMHWLRIDRYYTGEGGQEVVHQPMLCQHCEKAPCEYVCPVNATTHSPDGLNEMTYNRCVGTRFCSNNCPYKVRRFNWFRYTDTSERQLQKNPDVTVRARGVMEKCTYCVQRIRGAEIRARVARRAIAPGEVMTACQQACPTGAIQFGSLSHREEPVVRWRAQPRAYSVLQELGTAPRTQYLARISNPNPEIER